MLEPTDILMEISFNYQGPGKCKFDNGSFELSSDVVAELISDYDEEENDSIVCITTKIRDVPFVKVMELLNQWTVKHLKTHERISMEVHCGIDAAKISLSDANQIRLDTNAWQLDSTEDLHNFIYMYDLNSSININTIIKKQITEFWTTTDEIVNI